MEEIIGPVRLIMRGFMICFYILQSWYYDRRDCEKWRIIDIARVQQNNTTNLQQR